MSDRGDIPSEDSRTRVPPAAYLINLTGAQVDVVGAGRSVVLAPLRRLPLSASQLCRFDATVLRDSELVALERPEVTATRAPLAVYGVLTVLALIAVGIGGLNGALSLGLAVAGALAVLGVMLWSGWTMAGVVAGHPPTVQESLRWLSEKSSQLLVFVIGFGSALAAALVANGGLEGGRIIADERDLFRIGLQTLFLGLAITFPAFLYYAFDRQRAAGLRTRFLADVFRLDDRLSTVGKIEAKYGGRMKDAFGDAGDRLPNEERVRSGRRRSPVVIATLVLSLALVVAFVDVGATETEGPLLALFTPTSAILPFAFLGAYLFGVLSSLRSYLREDLLPKAYSQIAARMLVVVTLAAVISALAQVLAPEGDDPSYSPWLLALAFLAGLVPNTVLQFLSEATRRVFPLGRSAALREPQPLNLLQGIDLYDRARLEQEGITTLDGIVHGDLVDVMMQTRISAGLLVSWVDQAVLLKLAGTADTEDEDAIGASSMREAWRAALSAEGIRTASGLLRSRPTRPELDGLVTLVKGEPVMRRVLRWNRDELPDPIVLDARAPELMMPRGGTFPKARASVDPPTSTSASA